LPEKGDVVLRWLLHAVVVLVCSSLAMAFARTQVWQSLLVQAPSLYPYRGAFALNMVQTAMK
jgi:hypothetical protein